jgi:hypothetical protein
MVDVRTHGHAVDGGMVDRQAAVLRQFFDTEDEIDQAILAG